MSRGQRNQQGFSIVELLLVLILLSVVGGIGYVVYTGHHKTVTANTAPAPAAHTTTTARVDPYAGWQQYCSTPGGLCFKYPTNWKLASAETPDPTITGATLTSPSGNVTVQYVPVISGIGGDCNPNTCFFNALSITKPSGNNTGNLKLVKGIFTNKSSTAILANYFVSSDDIIANAKLAVGQNVDVGYFVDALTNPKGTGSGTEFLQVKPTQDNGFNTTAEATAWLSQPEVITGGQILASVTIQ